MRQASFKAFLLSLLLALIACGPASPEGAQSPTTGGAEGGKTTAASQAELAGRDKGDPESTGAKGGEGAADTGVLPAAPPGAIGRGGLGAEGDGAAAQGSAGRGGPTTGAVAAGGAMGAAGYGALGPIPVTAGDPAVGKSTALVTIVVFSDLQCPFCRRVAPTLADLRAAYGENLRIVWKNNPLPFHLEARPAAETAMALFESGGNAAFWGYHDRVFGSSGALDKATFEAALKGSGVSQQEIDRIRARGGAARKVDADMELAKRVGATGTPAFFINGVFLSGAQPIERFREIVDAELAKAKTMVAGGVAPDAVYVRATSKNFVAPAPRAAAVSADAVDDKTVHLVPIGRSPVKGKADALVTIVEFSDFECPFCMRVEPTIEQVVAKYGAKVRVVWKNNPLPFHKRAEPAAELALEAHAQKGDAGFWTVHGLLFAAKGKLTDQDLETIATSAGLKAKPAMDAVAKSKYKALIEADQELADDLAAHGTPSFFINGRRLVGAQPLERFVAVIDEEIAKAEALVAKGTPAAKVYDAIQKEAKPPPPPETKTVPAPGKESPSKGPANAKVVIQVFSDFQCPFCKRVEPTLDELMAAFPGKVRIVWRNMPLSMHPQAALAAEAALEARAQKGDAAFWKMHHLLFEDQTEAGLGREGLVKHASAVGLNAAKFTAALDAGKHTAAVDADKKVASAAGITGTPAFVINGYFISGAQPLAKFKKLVARALAEAK
jgi:protein-disulfide isomerase